MSMRVAAAHRAHDGRAPRAQWTPQLMRVWRVSVPVLLGTFLALQFLVPARLVIAGMGAAGRPSVAVGILLAFLWALCALRPHALPAGRQPVRWAVGVFFASQLVGYAIGFDRGPSSIEASSSDRWMILVVSVAGVALAVADGIRTRADLDRLLNLLVGFSAAMSAVGILQFFSVIDLTQHVSIPGLRLNGSLIIVGARGDVGVPRVAGSASHYIEFGVVLALILPIALHYAFFAPPGRVRQWRWLMVALVAFGIPLSISRSATLTVAVSMVVLAVVWPWRRRYNVLVMTMICIVGFRAVTPGVLGTIRSLFTHADQDPSVQDRIARTDYVMQLWHMRPWLGRGAGMVIPEQYILLDNQWFVTLLAGGVVGVLTTAAFFAIPYFTARSVRLRGRDAQTRHLAQALAATMPAAVLSAGTFDAFSFPTWVGVMSVLVGATGALWRLDGTSRQRPLATERGNAYVNPPLMASRSEPRSIDDRCELATAET